MEPEFDVIVVGAGPGGATAAAFLARAGVRTLLLDKAHFPRDKACGDAVCTKSVRILRELGLVEAVERETCARVKSQVLIGPQGAALPLPFVDQVGRRREPGSVYVIRRERFDNVLFQHARSLRGVTAIEGFDVSDLLHDGARVAGVIGTDDSGREQRYRASIVIGADGALSRVAQMAGAYDFKRRDHRHWIGAFRRWSPRCKGATARRSSTCASAPTRCWRRIPGCARASPAPARWRAASAAGSSLAGASGVRWQATAGC
jgi:flavin-dependent dehydrogenase